MVSGVVKAEFDPGKGNYLLRGIEEIPLPEQVSWWPETLGRLIVGLLILGWLLWRALVWTKNWQRDSYRRRALKRLDALDFEGGEWDQATSCLPVLLKSTALHAYPRAEVASLSGQQWLEFLRSQCDVPAISEETGCLLLQVAYQPRDGWGFDQHQAKALKPAVRSWIKYHRAGVPDD